jgi:hypothetical protein
MVVKCHSAKQIDLTKFSNVKGIVMDVQMNISHCCTVVSDEKNNGHPAFAEMRDHLLSFFEMMTNHHSLFENMSTNFDMNKDLWSTNISLNCI